MKKTRFKKYTYLILAWALVFLTLTITSTFAWLFLDKSADITITPGGFGLQASVLDKAVAYNPENGVYKFNGLTELEYQNALDKLTDPTKKEEMVGLTDHHVNNICINITAECEIKGYLRVKLLDEWVVSRRYLSFDRVSTESIFRSGDQLFPYKLAPGWYYDEVTQYCYYGEMLDRGSHKDIPFILGCDNYNPKTSTLFVESCQVNIATIVQAVQVNRYQEVWGITKIPTSMEVTPNA